MEKNKTLQNDWCVPCCTEHLRARIPASKCFQAKENYKENQMLSKCQELALLFGLIFGLFDIVMKPFLLKDESLFAEEKVV